MRDEHEEHVKDLDVLRETRASMANHLIEIRFSINKNEELSFSFDLTYLRIYELRNQMNVAVPPICPTHKCTKVASSLGPLPFCPDDTIDVAMPAWLGPLTETTII